MKGLLRGAVAPEYPELPEADESRRLADMLPRVALAALIMVPVIWALSDRLAGLDAGQIRAAVAAMSWPALLSAIVLTAISFTAISFYDVIGVRALRLGMPPAYVVRSGFAATAIGQTLGFGLIVGTAVRWRFYRHHGVSPAGSAAITGFVSVSFMVGIVLLLAVSCIVEPQELAPILGLPAAALSGLAWVGLIASASVLILCALQPVLRIGRLALRPPRFRAVTAMLGLTVLDVVPAAAILWMLIPADVAPSFAILLPIYLAAMCVGLISNAPGGLGVLEFACLIALPQVPQADMVAALIVYRAIFYGLPFIIGAAWLMDHEWRTGASSQAVTEDDRRAAPRLPDMLPSYAAGDVPSEVWKLLRTSHRAEAGLALMGDKSFLMSPDRRAMLICAEEGNALVSLSDPIGPQSAWPAAIRRLQEEARTRMVVPVAYKVSPRAARFFHNQGWTLSRIGQEAVVDVAAFSLQGAARRELRRKCAKPARAGVTFHTHLPGRAPMARLAPVSGTWLSGRNRSERGFSLGRFDPAYLAAFDIIEARQDDRSIGFVSLWRSGDGAEWSIDLMRANPDAPDGIMHALIVEAIALARAQGAQKFSLCAVPLAGIDAPDTPLEHLSAWLFRTRGAARGLTGLHRFKQCFRPDWQPVYMATRGRGLPVFGLMAIYQLIEGAGQPNTR